MTCKQYITARKGERRTWHVQFASEYGTFEIDSVTVQAFDEDDQDVTDEIIDDSMTFYSGDTAQFMTIAEETGQYTILVSAHSPTTELPIAKLILTVID